MGNEIDVEGAAKAAGGGVLSTDLRRRNFVDNSGSCFAHWSDDEVIDHLKRLAAVERALLPDVLACLAEIERRHVPLDRGYANLLEFCVDFLGWTEGSAMHRIIAARTAPLFPEIYSYLRDGQLNLSAVSRLAPLLTMENHSSILDRAAGRKRKELDELLAELRAGSQAAPAPIETSPEPSLPLLAGGGSEESNAKTPSVEAPAPAVDSPVIESRRVRFSCVLDENAFNDFERVRFLLRDRCPGAGEALAAVVRFFLKRSDPDRRKPALEKPPRTRQTRRIPRWVRDRVWRRDGGRCAYVSMDGRRCGARSRLEYDHVRPWARGGLSDDPANVRLLCRAHNVHAARQAFGR